MAAENKETVITASVLLYAVFYLALGISGISFQFQPARGYVYSQSNSGCEAGAMWVQGDDLRWCGDGSTEVYANPESGDSITNHGSVSGPDGAVWIQGSDFHWIAGGNEYSFPGDDTGNDPSAPNGAVWVQNKELHYIDQNGNERKIPTSTN